MPVIVNGKEPVGVLATVFTVRVELPDASDPGLKDHVAPVGKPLTLKVTLPLKPPEGVTVAV